MAENFSPDRERGKCPYLPIEFERLFREKGVVGTSRALGSSTRTVVRWAKEMGLSIPRQNQKPDKPRKPRGSMWRKGQKEKWEQEMRDVKEKTIRVSDIQNAPPDVLERLIGEVLEGRRELVQCRATAVQSQKVRMRP